MNGVMPLRNPIQLYLGLKAGPKVFGYINEWLHFSINVNKAGTKMLVGWEQCVNMMRIFSKLKMCWKIALQILGKY